MVLWQICEIFSNYLPRFAAEQRDICCPVVDLYVRHTRALCLNECHIWLKPCPDRSTDL